MEKAEKAIPSRSADPPATATQGSPALPPPERSWRDVGAGVAVVLALRYLVPRLLRRI